MYGEMRRLMWCEKLPFFGITQDGAAMFKKKRKSLSKRMRNIN